jgi:hypothetical protein
MPLASPAEKSQVKLLNRIIFAVVSLICLDSALIQRADASAEQNLAGAIVSVKDLAYILPGGKASAKVAAKPGASIHVHDSITISDSGAVKILLSDHSIIDLGPSTVFKIDEYLQKHGSDREVEVSMKGGSVRGAVTEKLTGTGKFHLKTPSATMGVRGTEFVAQTDAKGATQFTVLQGQVEVAQSSPSGKSNSGSFGSGKAVTVKAGQQVTSSVNAALPSKPVTLSASALGKIASSTKFADNTFSKAVTIEASSKGGKGSETGKDGKAKESRKPSSGSSNSGSSSSGSSSGSSSSGSSSSGSAPASGSAPSSGGGSESGGGGGGSGAGPAPANAPASGGGDSSSGNSSSGGGNAASGGPAPASVSGGGGDASGGGSASSGGPAPASVSSGGGDASAASGGGGAGPSANGGGGGSTMSEIVSTISASNSAPPIVNPAQSIAGAPNPVTQAAPVTTTKSAFSHVTINIQR